MTDAPSSKSLYFNGKVLSIKNLLIFILLLDSLIGPITNYDAVYWFDRALSEINCKTNDFKRTFFVSVFSFVDRRIRKRKEKKAKKNKKVKRDWVATKFYYWKFPFICFLVLLLFSFLVERYRKRFELMIKELNIGFLIKRIHFLFFAWLLQWVDAQIFFLLWIEILTHFVRCAKKKIYGYNNIWLIPKPIFVFNSFQAMMIKSSFSYSSYSSSPATGWKVRWLI